MSQRAAERNLAGLGVCPDFRPFKNRIKSDYCSCNETHPNISLKITTESYKSNSSINLKKSLKTFRGTDITSEVSQGLIT